MHSNTDHFDGACDFGVVVLWIDRPKFGRYGYLTPYKQTGNRAGAVIYFDQNSLIDSSEPISEGSLVHFEIQEDEPDGRIKAVKIEIERFTAHIPELDFNKSDLWDFPVLKPSDLLDNHLLKGLSPELNQSLERYRQKDWTEIPPDLVKYLNTVIGEPSLFEKRSFAKIKLRRLTSLILGKKTRGYELRWLNRLLLEDAYPDSIIPKPWKIDCSSQIYQGSVVERNGRSRTGCLQLLNGQACLFSFEDFPTDALVPNTGEYVECRIYDESRPYDIWQISSETDGQLGSTDELRVLMATADRKHAVWNSETRKNIALMQAVIKEASEAFRPLHEFYRDPRLRKARVDAINAGLPELFVDTIAGKMHMGEKFPTTDILHRYLSNPLLAKKLGAAEGKLFSRATIGRWLTEFKMILQRRGFPIQKYRVRNTMLKDNPSEPSEGFAGDGENPQDEDEKGKTKPDTRDQELPEGADNSD